MKKVLCLVLAALMIVGLVSCKKEKDINAKGKGVMTYAEYEKAAIDDPVVIEAYVQGKQSWWEDKATLYLQDGDGGYFVYNCKCSEADYAKLVPGTKVKVTGVKANYADEIEIADGEFQIETDVTYIAEATDLTSKLATDDIVKYQNMFASFKGLTVEPIKDGDGVEHAWIYNWDGSGEEGSDIYFNVSIDGKTFQFLIESYLCDSSTEVYKAAKELQIGDKIDVEAFVYWYNGVNPHVTKITK